MKCPYCGAEKKKGYISSRDKIQWSSSESFKNVKLAGLTPFGASVTAFLCEDCKKVVINYSE